jgi:hypothetical protein
LIVSAQGNLTNLEDPYFIIVLVIAKQYVLAIAMENRSI